MPRTKARSRDPIPWDAVARIRRAVLLGVVVAVPVVFVRYMNDAINVPKLTTLMIAVAVVSCVRFAEWLIGGDKPDLDRITAPAIAIAGALTIGWLFSPYKGWSLWGNYPRFVGLLPYLVAIAFGVLLFDSFKKDPAPIAWALMASGAVVGGYATIQALGLDPLEWNVRGSNAGNITSSTLGNPNFVGGFLAMVLSLGVGMLYIAIERRALAISLLAPIVLGWLVSRSESGLAAGLAGVAIVLGFALTPRWNRARALGAIASAVVFIGVVGSVLLNMTRDEPVLSTTIDRRADWWQGAAAMAGGSPLVGRGPGVFALEGPKHRTVDDGRIAGFDFTDDPHSLWLVFLTSAGVIGFVGLLIAIGWLLREGAGLKRTDMLGAAFLGALVAYVVQASVSVDTVALRTSFWAVAAGLLATRALADAPPDRTTSRRETRTSRESRFTTRNLVAAGTVCVLGLGAVWWSVRFAISDLRFRHALDLVAAGRGTEALDEFDAAMSFRLEPYYQRVYGRTIGSIAVGFAEQGESDQAEELFERADAAFSYTRDLPHANSIVDHARLLLGWSDTHPAAHREAMVLFDRALVLDPNNVSLQDEAGVARAR